MEIDLKRRQKRRSIEKMLNDEYILVQVNTSTAGLSLPKHLTELPSVTLKLSRLFRGAMTLNDSGISADLLFNGAYFTCILPLDSIWACSGASGTIQQWDDSVPAELIAGFIAEAQETQLSKPQLPETQLAETKEEVSELSESLDLPKSDSPRNTEKNTEKNNEKDTENKIGIDDVSKKDSLKQSANKKSSDKKPHPFLRRIK